MEFTEREFERTYRKRVKSLEIKRVSKKFEVSICSEMLRKLAERHNELKERIHRFRIPLSPGGRFLMGIVYCGTPLLIGYGAYHWSMGRAEKNLGSEGDKLRERLTYADKNRIREANRERLEKIRQLGMGSKSSGSGKQWVKDIDNLRRDQ